MEVGEPRRGQRMTNTTAFQRHANTGPTKTGQQRQALAFLNAYHPHSQTPPLALSPPTSIHLRTTADSLSTP